MTTGRFAAVCALLLLLAAAGVCAPAKTFDVTGKVLLPDGSPAVGARVDVGRPPVTVVTDSSGAFTLKLSPNWYKVVAHLPGLVNKPRDYFQIHGDGKVSGNTEFKLEPGCEVVGKVVDKSTGKPVGGAVVRASYYISVKSEADGTFHFDALPSEVYSFTVEAPGMCRAPMTVSAVDQRALDLTLETKPGGTVSGKVTGEGGKPIAGAHVSLADSRGDISTSTGADGRYKLEGLDPDEANRLYASAQGYEYAESRDAVFAEGKREASADFVLDSGRKKATRSFSGLVISACGKPVKGATVAFGLEEYRAGFARTTTDSNGRYTLKGASGEPSLMVVQCASYSAEFRFLPEDARSKQNFVLRPGNVLEAQIVDEDGKPIAGARINLSAQTAEMEKLGREAWPRYPRLEANTETDKQGMFKLKSCPAGTVRVSAFADGYNGVWETPLLAGVKGQKITLNFPRDVAGTVLSAVDGKPITDFTVSHDHGYRSTKFQSPDGRFRLKNVGSGFREPVTVEAKGYRRAVTANVESKRAEKCDPAAFKIRLQPAEDFCGVVTDASGKPVEGVLVTVLDTSVQPLRYAAHGGSMDAYKPISARTDAGGKFTIAGCPTEKGAVTLEKPGFGRIVKEDVNLYKPFSAGMAAGGVIVGKAFDHSGKALPPGDISVVPFERSIPYTRGSVSEDGTFRIPDVSPGRYILSFLATGTRPVRCVAVRAGEECQLDWDSGPATLEGRVTMVGKPAAGVEISATATAGRGVVGSTRSAEDGTYRMPLPDTGRYRIHLTNGKYESPEFFSTYRSQEVKAGTNRLDTVLPSGSIAGTVVDGKTGKPVSGASVIAWAKMNDADIYGEPLWVRNHVKPFYRSFKQSKTDAKGNFRIQNLPEGEWTVSASFSSDGMTGASIPHFRLRAGEARAGVKVTMPQTGAAHILVADAATGKALNAFITAKDEHGVTVYPERDLTCPGGG